MSEEGLREVDDFPRLFSRCLSPEVVVGGDGVDPVGYVADGLCEFVVLCCDFA